MPRIRGVAAALAALCTLGVLAPGASATGVSRTATPPQVLSAEQLVGAALPADGGLAPAASTRMFPSPLPRHVVLGFIGASGFQGVTSNELFDVSELVSNMVTLTAAGSLSTASTGWADLSEAGFPDFVTDAHASGDRVLLGIAGGSPAAMAHLLRGATRAATTLAGAVLPIVAADHLDGVDLDVEAGTARQAGAFTTFVSTFERALARGDVGAELVVNVSPTAASTTSFFDVAALARVASALFVMDYDMVPGGIAGANAPLVAAPPQVSDLSSLLAYTRVVPPSKLILGVPFYGYDFPTATRIPGAATTGPAESVTYADIVLVGRVGHWDASTLTPYYVFQRGKQWHETYYDDPVSIALKTALASVLHLGGVGVWSLGQEGPSTAMLAALDGGDQPLRLQVASG